MQLHLRNVDSKIKTSLVIMIIILLLVNCKFF